MCVVEWEPSSKIDGCVGAASLFTFIFFSPLELHCVHNVVKSIASRSKMPITTSGVRVITMRVFKGCLLLNRMRLYVHEAFQVLRARVGLYSECKGYHFIVPVSTATYTPEHWMCKVLLRCLSCQRR